MDLNAILQKISPEVHASLKRAIEIGKWADGSRLDREQRELCLQAVIAWEAMYLPPEERTGHIDRGEKTGQCESEPEVIRIVRDRGL